MAAIDKLVIEITGDASGLTKALNNAQKNLTNFNSRVVAGDKALKSLISGFTRAASASQRLATTINSVKTSFTGLNRSVNSSASSVNKFGSAAKKAASDIKSFSSQLSKIAESFGKLQGASKGAQAALNNLERRVAALGKTVSAVNGNMRTFNSRIQTSINTASRGGVTINNYGRGIAGAGNAAGRSATLFQRLNKANISLAEGFRRHVAQLTALRTLVYQGLFWFSPLIYSVIKVNAAYEKQIQLLKNLSGQSTELAKTQWALETRKQLVELANTNPFSLEQITNTFVRMKVSGLDPLNGSMKTLMDSIAAFGGGNDELDRAAIALQQMVGKSAVSMEELRQQLGEHIPDAMSAMAAGMGLSMAEFYKAVKTGTVESTSAIHNMLVVLRNHHTGAAASMMNTWNGLMARMGTAWQNFVAKIEHSNGGNTFIEKLKQKVQDLIVFLNTPAGVHLAVEIENAFMKVVDAISWVIKKVYEWRNVIVEAAKIFAYMWGGKLIVGTILSVASTFAKLWAIIRGGIILLKILTGQTTAAAGSALLFGRNTSAAATATKIFNGAASALNATMAMSAGQLALLALRFAGIIGVVVAATTAIWGMVSALNAEANAQRTLNSLPSRIKEGDTWKEDENGNSPERDQARAKLENAKKIRAAGGHYVWQAGDGHTRTKKWVPWSAQDEKSFKGDVANFNIMQESTRNARKTASDMKFENSQRDPYAATRAKFADLSSKVNPNDPNAGKKIRELEAQEREQYIKDADADIARLKAMNNPNAQALLEKRIKERNDFLNNPFKEQKTIANPNGKNGKNKKGGGGGPKSDPLQKYRDRFASAFVATADLQHQYDDLKNGTSTEFDAEAAQAEGDRLAGLLKTAEALKQAAANEKSRQEEIRKSIKVEQAIIDVEKKAADERDQINDSMDDLFLSYRSIQTESDHYRKSLEREHSEELKIAEARIKSGEANEDQIRQYKQLTNAILDATRAHEALLLVEAAKESKQNVEDYQVSLLSPRGQQQYADSKRITELQANITAANKVIDNYSAERLKILNDIGDAEENLRNKTKEGNQTQINAAQQAIVVERERLTQYDQLAAQMQQILPYYQQEINMIQERARVQNQWGGAGGPMYDWAKKANDDFQDLGTTMGNVFVQGMDDMINSLANGKMAFKDFTKTVLKQLLLIILRGLIAKAILSALGVGAAPSAPSANTTAFLNGVGAGTDFSVPADHGGGIAGGTPTFTKQVDPAVFSFAKRYHTGGVIGGLRQDEVPIIAQRGEGVFTKEQMAAMGTGAAPNVTVNVINESGTAVDAESKGTKFDGEKWVETIILKKMATPGPVRTAMQGINKR